MAAHLSPRCPRRGAQRRAGTVASGVHPGMHWPEGARARARPGGAGTGASTDRHGHARPRPVPPSCVTRSTPSLWDGYGSGTGARLAQFRPGFLTPLVLQRKVRYVYIHRPAFPLDSATALSAPRPPLPVRTPQLLAGCGASWWWRCVDAFGRIGTGPPPGAPTGAPRQEAPRAGPTTSPGRSGSQGSPRFLWVLPGFSPAVPTGM